MKYKEIPQELEEIGKAVVDAAYIVHKAFGPGLLEKVNEIPFCHEIRKKGLECKRQVYIPIIYDGIEFEEGLRLDVIIEDKVIIELKAIETVNHVWEAQIINHLKLTNNRLGFLINFNVPLIKQGIRRFVN